PDDYVTGAHARAIEHAALLDDADAESGEIVFAGAVKTRQLRRLAADQRATGLHATLGDAFDDLLCLRRAQPAGGKIIKKNQWFRAADDDVVDAHRDQVDPDRVVLSGEERELELGPHAVGAHDQHRLV